MRHFLGPRCPNGIRAAGSRLRGRGRGGIRLPGVLAGLLAIGQGAAAEEGGSRAVSGAGANEAARLLAGMPVEARGLAGELAATRVWKSHAEALDQQWGRYERATLSPMEEWSGAELGPLLGDGGVVRYMFSGPDILHAVRVFPRGGIFIMAGLEPVGELPDLRKLSEKTLAKPLAETRKALEEIIQFSFFKTVDMKVDLSRATFRGTLPILCLFLARTGIEIESVDFLALEADGSLANLGGESGGADAVRLVTALDGNMRRKTIYYFQTDVSNGQVRQSGFLKFLEAHEAGASYVKAASYLMHNSYFSVIRDHLLAYSEVLVEDDSGIPLRHFRPAEWSVSFYGSYSAPIPLFQEHYQPDLRKAYQEGRPKALDFGTGYRWRQNDSNLLVATRMPDAPAALPTAIVAVEVAVADPEGIADPSALLATVEAAAIPVAGIPAVDLGGGGPESVPSASRPASRPATDPAPTAALAGAAEAAGGPQVPRPVSDEPVEVTLKLASKSDLGTLGEVPGNALAVYEYEVVSVQRGDYPYPTMRLADGVFWNGRRTPLASRATGTTISLEAVPLRTYPSLEKMRRIDTLAPAGLPVFVPSL